MRTRFKTEWLFITSATGAAGRPRIPIRQRLERYRAIRGSCWEWTGYTDKDGYGSICLWHDGLRVSVAVPRVAAAVYLGFDLQDELLICHHCDNPLCFNPEHLFPGTSLDNNRDMAGKGRKVVCSGPETGHAKLTGDDVVEIRRRRSSGITCKQLASQYGVHPHTIWLANNGKNWKHISA